MLRVPRKCGYTALQTSSKAHARFLTDVRAQVTSMSVAWMICKLGTVLNVALRGQAKLRKNHTNPIVVAKALLGSDAVAVAVAVLILFRYLSNGRWFWVPRLGYNHFEALAGRGSIFTDFLLNSHEKPTILGPWLARARFSLIFY